LEIQRWTIIVIGVLVFTISCTPTTGDGVTPVTVERVVIAETATFIPTIATKIIPTLSSQRATSTPSTPTTPTSMPAISIEGIVPLYPFPDNDAISVLADPTTDANFINWLLQAKSSSVSFETIQSALLSIDWIEEESDFQSVDLTGDGNVEWLLNFTRQPNTQGIQNIHRDFWIINDTSSLYKFSAQADNRAGGYLKMLDLQDFTGDGLPDILLGRTGCGSHGCWTWYYFVSQIDEQFTHLDIQYPIRSQEWGKTFLEDSPDLSKIPAYISASTGDFSFDDIDDDDLPELVLEQVVVASGIGRERTESWGWNGENIVLKGLTWHETDHPFHLLREANDKVYLGDYPSAKTIYEQLFNEQELAMWSDDEGTLYDENRSIHQFAAFRMATLAYLEQNETELLHWNEWFSQEGFDTKFSEATALLYEQWQEDVDLTTACHHVLEHLPEWHDDYFPVIEKWGVLVPPLTVADLCPID
jgi:hypothetical protein